MAKTKPYLLGMYEKALPANLTWKEKLEGAKECGFDWIEISVDESDAKIARLDWTKEERDELVRLMKETGTPIYTMCFSSQRKYSLGCLNPETHAKAMSNMAKAIDLAADLGIRIIQLAGYDAYYEERSEATVAEFKKNLKIAAEMAARKGVILAFETMMDTDFLNTVEKGVQYCAEVNSPYLGVYPDIGNLVSARHDYGYEKSVVDDLKSGAGKIVACHLKETAPGKDRNVPWGTGLTDYVTDIKVLKDLGVRMFNGEFWYTDQPDWKAYCKEANAFLRDKLDQVFTD